MSGITDVIPKENGHTFIENALIKARFAAKTVEYKTPIISDDSGLCIENLNNEPGIHSARWAKNNNYSLAFKKIINKINKNKIQATGQKANFVCVLVLINKYKKEFIYKGILKGTLAFPPRGTLGFGYDPIFIPLNKRLTFGEMSPKKKYKIDHRIVAFKKIKKFF
mgnify:CR=1 FL=1